MSKEDSRVLLLVLVARARTAALKQCYCCGSYCYGITNAALVKLVSRVYAV